MNRTRALILSLAVGLAAVSGSSPLRTVALGDRHTPPGDARSRGEPRSSNRYETSRDGPCTEAPAASAIPTPARPLPQRGTHTVIYHRPPPIVDVIHRAGGRGKEQRATTRAGGEKQPMTSHRALRGGDRSSRVLPRWAASLQSRGRPQADPRVAALAARQQQLQHGCEARATCGRVATPRSASSTRAGRRPRQPAPDQAGGARAVAATPRCASSTCHRSSSRGRHDATAFVLQSDGHRRSNCWSRRLGHERSGLRRCRSRVRAARAGDVAVPADVGALGAEPRGAIDASHDLAEVVELALEARERTAGRLIRPFTSARRRRLRPDVCRDAIRTGRLQPVAGAGSRSTVAGSHSSAGTGSISAGSRGSLPSGLRSSWPSPGRAS